MNQKILVAVFLFCISSFIGVNAKIDDKFKRDFYDIYKHVAIDTKDLTNQHVSPDQVKYFLFTKNNKQTYIEINPANPKALVNPDAKIVFLIHGWVESRDREWYEDLKNAFLTRPDNYYVVQVDWSVPAHQTYTVSSWNTKEVGYLIGDFIIGLNRNYSISFENVLLVGHSLGGQVAGFVGKKVQKVTGEKLPRIVALDPAGPFFTGRPETKRLNKNDAEVVQVIHTDGGTFGFKASCGTIDFYPNGGNLQPGCARIDLLDIKSVAEPVICDHSRSWAMYIEAVLNPNALVGRKCSSWIKFKTHLCPKIFVPMGDLTTHETGDFYLSTNRDRPYTKQNGEFGLDDVLDWATIPLKEFSGNV